MNTRTVKSLAVATLILSLALALAAGCASRQDVQTLDQRNRQTMQEARELFKQLEEQIAIAREEARKSSAPVQAKQADIWAEVEGLKTEVAAMKGQLDTLNMRMGAQNSQDMAQLNERLKAVELALETQFAVDLGKGAKTAATTPSPAPAAESAGVEAAPQDPADALYAKGLSAFKERKYDEARRDFAEFTTTFKKHALVPNAVFWQGECYYQMGDYAKAVLAYDDVVQKHKDSPKYRSAMLKQGISFYKLGKEKPGKIILQELIDKNPGTAEANRAKQFLADPKK